MIILSCQLLLDYNDLMKLPFYDIIDKMINQHGLTLRYAADLNYNDLSHFICLGVFLFDISKDFTSDVDLTCGFKGLIPRVS